MTVTSSSRTSTEQSARVPARLHHNAHVVRDQRVTRRFYGDLIGLPLLATWTEIDQLFGAERVYCHTFYGLADGSALAFFQFANPADHEQFRPEFRPSPFLHIAMQVDQETQDGIGARLDEAKVAHHVIDHGYCVSLYVDDPDGLKLEFTVDDPDADEINARRLQTAEEDLERWMNGDHRSNNTYRQE